MIYQVKKVFKEIEKLAEEKQKEFAQLILDELVCNSALMNHQNKLAQMAKEAIVEYKADKTSKKGW